MFLTPTPGLLEAVSSAGAVQAGSQPTAGAALTTPRRWAHWLVWEVARWAHSQGHPDPGEQPVGVRQGLWSAGGPSEVTHIRLKKTSPNPAEQVRPVGEQVVESPAGGAVPPQRGMECTQVGVCCQLEGTEAGGWRVVHTEPTRLRNAQRRGGKGPGFSQPTWSTTGSLGRESRQAQPYNRLDSSRGQ